MTDAHQGRDDRESGAATPRSRGRSIEIGWEIRWALWAIVILTVLQSLVAKPFYIPSVSMTPTLLVGDHIIVNKAVYGWSWVSPVPRLLPEFGGRLFGRAPRRGEVVVVKAPMRDADYIKRVIAVAGDVVEVRSGAVILNGRPLRRVAAGTTAIPVTPATPCTEGTQAGHAETTPGGARVCRLPVYRETMPGGPTYDTLDIAREPELDDMRPLRVPAGRVFLMGDNRDQSSDSRVAIARGGLGGPVPVENVVGRAEVVTFSFDGTAIAALPGTWLKSLRPDRNWRWIGRD